jgi:hypothetical protein
MEDEILELKLPDRVPYKLNDGETNKLNLDEEQIQLVDHFLNFIESNLFSWKKLPKNFQIHEFIFNLPKTVFQEKTEISYQNYGNLEVEYNDDDLSLTERQLTEIWKKGEFSVESKIPGLPYVWKLSDFTVKGRENINENFIHDMGLFFTILYKLKYRFKKSYKPFDLSFQRSFLQIFKGIGQILNNLVGISCKTISSRYEMSINNYILSDSTKKLAIKLEENQNVYDYSIHFSPKKNLLNIIQTSFDSEWNNKEIVYEQEMFEQQMSQNEIKAKLAKIKNKEFLERIQKGLENDPQSLNEIINAIKAEYKYNKYLAKYNLKISKEKEILLKKINEENQIFSKNYEWRENTVAEQLQPIIEKEGSQKDQVIENKIRNFTNCCIIKNHNEERERQIDKLRETVIQNYARDLPTKYEAKRKYEITRYLFPPYEKKEIIDYKGRIRYALVRKRDYDIHSRYYFWRVWLFLARFYAWTGNIAFFMFVTIWNSSFGLKALCFREVFMDLSIDTETGEVTPCNPTFTWISALQNLFNWITESRNEFENAPDTGFFGKNCARIFNLLINYIGKGIIIGVFVYFVYPILILLYFAIGLCIGLTCFVWSFLSALFLFFFNMLIYDFDAPSDRHCKFFPMITSILQFVFLGFFQLVLTFIAFFLQPILAILVFIFGILRYILRSVYDFVLMGFVKCFARRPRTDSGMAWKVKGPGLSSQYYNHIKIDDALLCVRAHLESLQLTYLQTKYNLLLDEPLNIIDSKVKRPMSRVDCSFNENGWISSTVSNYKSLLSRQIEERRNKFSKCPSNIKFTKEELFSLKLTAKEMIMNFIEKEKIDEIWAKHHLVPDAWNRITDIILQKSLNNEILLPLDDLDFRIELVPKFDSIVSKTKEALIEGNPNIKKLIIVRNNEKNENSDIFIPSTMSLYHINNPPFNIEISYLPQEIRGKYEKNIEVSSV